ncbi:TOM (translocase of outer membrane) complex component [Microbotryomycetes sp. JL221]|nr:TOM (translocase of outer membrane) complex component [Microbotryomycetes sp. JL221]
MPAGKDIEASERHKKRQRKAASCKPEECIWDSDAAPPLYKANEPSELALLRNEVQRLQSLVQTLSSSSTCSTKLAPRSATTFDANCTRSGPRSAENSDDFISHELAARLGEMTIKAFQARDVDVDNENKSSAVLAEARKMLDAHSSPVPPVKALSLDISTPSKRPISELIAQLPSRKWLTAAENQYWTNSAFYLHPLPKPRFEQHKRVVDAAIRDGEDPKRKIYPTEEPTRYGRLLATCRSAIALAVVAVIWSLGLVCMPTKAGLTQAEKLAASKTSADLCWSALTMARFMETPTVDTTTVLLLFAGHYIVLSAGDDVSGPGVGYLQIAMQACIQLDLHRDPTLLDQQYTPEEAEDRRRLFWVAFLTLNQSSVVYGRHFSMISYRDIDCRLPADVPDDKMGCAERYPVRDNFMTSILLRIKCAKISAQITDNLANIKEQPYVKILEYDHRLMELESSIPSKYLWATLETYDQLAHDIRACQTYLVHLCIAYERLRLHQPFLARSYHDAQFTYSKRVALEAAMRIVEIQVSPILARPTLCDRSVKVLAFLQEKVDATRSGSSTTSLSVSPMFAQSGSLHESPSSNEPHTPPSETALPAAYLPLVPPTSYTTSEVELGLRQTVLVPTMPPHAHSTDAFPLTTSNGVDETLPPWLTTSSPLMPGRGGNLGGLNPVVINSIGARGDNGSAASQLPLLPSMLLGQTSSTNVPIALQPPVEMFPSGLTSFELDQLLNWQLTTMGSNLNSVPSAVLTNNGIGAGDGGSNEWPPSGSGNQGPTVAGPLLRAVGGPTGPNSSSSSSLSTWVTTNRRVILVTCAVVASCATAYYALYVNGTGNTGRGGGSTGSATTGTTEDGKKKKKKSKKTKSASTRASDDAASDKAATPASKQEASREPDDEPSEADLESMDKAARSNLALQLKAKGNKLYSNKKFQEAAKMYTKAIACEEQAVFYSNRAACYTNLGQLEKVIEDCTSALRLDPQYIKALNRRATAKEQIGGVDNLYEALCDFTAAAIIDNFQTESTQASVEKVMKKLATEKATQILQKREPKLPSPTFIKAYLEAFRPQPKPAQPEQPSQGDETLDLAFSALDARDYTHAFTLFHEALDQDISSDEGRAAALNMRATFRFIMSDAREALADLDESTRIWPEGAQSWVKKASVHMELGQPEQAFRDFDKALEVDPQNPDVFYHRGQVYFITQEFDKAIQEYRRSSEIEPTFIFSHIQLAVAQYKNKSVEKAMHQFRKFIKEHPTSPEVFNYYGELLLDQGQYEEAVKNFEKSIELEKDNKPRNALPLVNKALAIFQWKQDFGEAEKICREAIDIDEQCDVAIATLAQLLLQQNKVHDAVKMFERSAEMARTEPELINALTYESATKAQIAFITAYPSYAEKLGLDRNIQA